MQHPHGLSPSQITFFISDFFFLSFWASLVAQTVKHLPAIRVTQVQSLSREDPLEKEMEIHARILVWRIQWTEKPGRLQSMGLQRVGHD